VLAGHAANHQAHTAFVTRPRIDLRCSFCGKKKEQVRKLVAGPGVFICDRCVVLCNEIINEPQPPTTPVMPPEAKWVGASRSRTQWWRHLFHSEVAAPA